MASYHQATTRPPQGHHKATKHVKITKFVTMKGAEIVQPPAVLDAFLSGDLHFLTPIEPRWRGDKVSDFTSTTA